ncbi:MAG: helix-turn-helix domain-containing protein [Breznakibacter sp.]
MFIVPEDLPNKHSFKIKKQHFHFVEYTAVNESTLNDVILSDSAIIYIIQGTKIITSNNSTTVVTPNKLILIPKGRYIMSEYLPEKGNFKSVMLLFNHHQISEIVNTISKTIKIEQKFESAMSVVDCTSQLEHYFESLLQIKIDTGQLVLAKDLLNIKIQELIYLLLSNLETRNHIIDLLHKTFANQKMTIAKIIQEDLYKSTPLKSLAQKCNMSVSTFKREFEKHYKASPRQWIMDRRLEKAYTLVKTTSSSVSDIAYECGFENYVSFARRFKSKYGHSANEIRALLQYF